MNQQRATLCIKFNFIKRNCKPNWPPIVMHEDYYTCPHPQFLAEKYLLIRCEKYLLIRCGDQYQRALSSL